MAEEKITIGSVRATLRSDSWQTAIEIARSLGHLKANNTDGACTMVRGAAHALVRSEIAESRQREKENPGGGHRPLEYRLRAGSDDVATPPQAMRMMPRGPHGMVGKDPGRTIGAQLAASCAKVKAKLSPKPVRRLAKRIQGGTKTTPQRSAEVQKPTTSDRPWITIPIMRYASLANINGLQMIAEAIAKAGDRSSTEALVALVLVGNEKR